MIKNILKSATIFICALGTIILIGSIDASDFDDQGLLDLIIEVPKNDNGFYSLSYTQHEGFALFSENDNYSKLKAHIYFEEWDILFVKSILEKHNPHIENALNSLSYKYFKFPAGPDIYHTPAYQDILGILRLILAKSMLEAERGNMNSAIRYLDGATNFSQAIKTEKNYWIISYMIGLVMQNESLTWMHRFISEQKLDQSQLRLVLEILEKVPEYSEDNFGKVFAGELVFVQGMLESTISAPLSLRMEEYWDGTNWLATIFGGSEIHYDYSTKERIIYFFQALFPGYYIHKNRLLDKSALAYSKLRSAASLTCDSISLEKEVFNAKTSWKLLLKPNIYGEYWTFSPSIFYDYFIKRCFGHAQIEALRAIVAIKQYELSNGARPGSLSDLIPLYLPSSPTDPFDGEELRYSKNQGWVYSVGTNFIDNKGALSGIFYGECHEDKACKNNPTFPIMLGSQD